MKYTSTEFTNLISGVMQNAVQPAITRELFPVQSEVSSSANVEFIKNTGNFLSDDWGPAGGATNFSSYTAQLENGSNPVIERRVALTMTHQDRLSAAEGRTLNVSDRVAQLLNEVEVEVDNITFTGKSNVKGIFNSAYFGTKKGTSITSAAAFSSATDIQIKDILLKGLTSSKGDGRYLGKKTILVNSSQYNVLRSKYIGNTAVTLLEYIKNNAPELAEIKEVPSISDILIYENNPAYLSARFTFPLQQVGAIKDEGGVLTAFFISRYAGIVVKNPQTLVRITGA